MLDTLLLIGLAPVLLWQGRNVRRSTLRLPEAAGARYGQIGRGPALRILLLGDSSAAGVGVSQQEQALAGQLSKQLSQDYQVSWQLLAESGITLQQLLARLDEVRGQYDVAVLAVGVNDVTAGTKDAVWVAQLQALRARLTAEFKVRNILVSAVPPMQHFTALPRPLSDYLGRRARRLNALTTRLAKQTAELTFMPIELGVSPQMLAADGFHPSAIAYDLWAQQVVAQLKSCSDTSQISNK